MKKAQKLQLQFLVLTVFSLLAIVIAYPKALSFAPSVKESVEKLKVNLGLDLQGGIHLEYAIDLSGVDSSQEQEALEAVQAVVERRVNAFGVGEPIVQRSQSAGQQRLIVELPGIENIDEAKNTIKETPFLEFREEREEGDPEAQSILDQLNSFSKKRADEVLEKAKNGDNFEELAKEYSQDPGSREEGGDLGFVAKGIFVPEFDEVIFSDNFENGTVYPELVETQFGWHVIKKIEERSMQTEGEDNQENQDEGQEEQKEVRAQHILLAKTQLESLPNLYYKPTELTGGQLDRAAVSFDSVGVSGPQVELFFDSDGTRLFEEITKRNLNKTIAIFLDNELVTAPVVQAEILDGRAVITGDYTLEEAKKLAQRLNEGALPVPISLVAQQSIEASLGAESLAMGLKAGSVGLVFIMFYMIIYYRLCGLVASLALCIYTATMVAIFKISGLGPQSMTITLTLSGIAGFILSIGMAVDANILIFERVREEMARGRTLEKAVQKGFERAWTSIRDGNLSTILTSLILAWIGSGFVKGFAIILMLGVGLSMFTAIIFVRGLLQIIVQNNFLKKHHNILLPFAVSKDKD